ncbi:hypothetical protein L0F81_33815 [Streptomyces tricolor]|uniref:Uncharacterized protein n=1 Tax=Streptomyces tricolor TaxID=68277 RepID=A0ABS9JRI4_9ACTN|nr:hypothetical protein [Streptomyces tricolor]MCG0068186.1 hypothetical protein [Streptomyces tricolor]
MDRIVSAPTCAHEPDSPLRSLVDQLVSEDDQRGPEADTEGGSPWA